MSLNVTVLTHAYAACATDRRLTRGTKVVGERGCKLIQFDCGLARGLITYNGIGRSSAGETPNDWVSDVLKEGNCTLVEFCDRLKAIAQPRIAALATEFGGNPRHSFVISAFEGFTPVLGLISNYESLDEKGSAANAAPELSVALRTPRAETPFGMIITGADHIVKRRSRDNLLDALKAARPEAEILKLMTKVIRDTAYRDRLRGSVGSSVLTSVFRPLSGFEMGSGVVGRSLIQESPDYVSAAVQYREMWVAALGPDQAVSGGYRPDRPGLPELACANPACRNPVPVGYRKCPACDTLVGG
jgi:hypothetical protein